MSRVFQHLDDPVPLPPSTREQRQATLHRGARLRRRRRTNLFAGLAGAAALVGAIALSPVLGGGNGAVPPVAASPSPSIAATATVGPGRGTITLGGTYPELAVTFTMPAGWETGNGWLFRSDNFGRSDPGQGMPFGFVFLDVANIYVDGCQWRLVDPPPGPSVDDLVEAYAKVPGFGGTSRDVTVDGFRGKLIEYTVPQYDAADCKDGRFGIFKEDALSGDMPNVIAQAPEQQNQIRILDVSGTRIVILAGYPPNISAQDRAELDAIVDSIQIG